MRQLRMDPKWVFLIRGDTGSYRIIGWIVSHRLDRIVSSGLDHIVSAGSVNTSFYALAGYWLDGTDGLDVALVGRGWDGTTLAPTGMVAPPLALEGRWSARIFG